MKNVYKRLPICLAGLKYMKLIAVKLSVDLYLKPRNKLITTEIR